MARRLSFGVSGPDHLGWGPAHRRLGLLAGAIQREPVPLQASRFFSSPSKDFSFRCYSASHYIVYKDVACARLIGAGQHSARPAQFHSVCACPRVGIGTVQFSLGQGPGKQMYRTRGRKIGVSHPRADAQAQRGGPGVACGGRAAGGASAQDARFVAPPPHSPPVHKARKRLPEEVPQARCTGREAGAGSGVLTKTRHACQTMAACRAGGWGPGSRP